MIQDTAAINRFANRVARYVASIDMDTTEWKPHRWMVEAITVVLTDEGCATEALTLIPEECLDGAHEPQAHAEQPLAEGNEILVAKVAEAICLHRGRRTTYSHPQGDGTYGFKAWGCQSCTANVMHTLVAIEAAGYVVVPGPVTEERQGNFWRADENGNPVLMYRSVWFGPWQPVVQATPNATVEPTPPSEMTPHEVWKGLRQTALGEPTPPSEEER